MLDYIQVDPPATATAAVIWLHGLGDSGQGFAPIVPELKLPKNHGVRFLFPHAPYRKITINNGYEMRGWYDIKSMDMNNRADETGVRESAVQVTELIEQQVASGIPAENIVLAGFSQGGVIALHLGLRYPQKLAGILAMSTYMSVPEKLANEAHKSNQQTPILMQHGNQDDVIPISAGEQAKAKLTSLNYQVDWQEYPMPHSVHPKQIKEIARWLTSRLISKQ